MSTSAVGLSAISLATLRGLAHAIDREAVRCPVSRARLAAAGYGEDAQTFLGALEGLDRQASLAVLRAVIAERVHRPDQHLELVWSGPLAPQAAHRDTGVVMRQLFRQAQEHVLIGGFRFDAGADLFQPLHQAMETRGVTAEVFLDIEGNARTASEGPAFARKRIDEFFDKNWPFEGKRPAVFYDPRTAVPGPPWASLHAKCVVVDRRWSLVTSANFTNRGQTRNIELGVLIDDANFAHQITTQWQALLTNRLLQGVKQP